jgi:hypothetical protein
VVAPSAWIAIAVSILALTVSLAGAVISGLAYRRVVAAEQVLAWLEVSRTTRPEWILAIMHVKNPSRLQIKLFKLMIEVTPDFKMGNYEAALVTDPHGQRILPKDFEVKDHYVAMACSSQGKIVVPIGGTASVPFLIYQASFSRKSTVDIGLMFETMEAKPRFQTIQTTARVRREI